MPEVRPLRIASLVPGDRGVRKPHTTVPVTFSFRGNLDIRHRLPDRMGQGVIESSDDIPGMKGFYAPEQRVLLFR